MLAVVMLVRHQVGEMGDVDFAGTLSASRKWTNFRRLMWLARSSVPALLGGSACWSSAAGHPDAFDLGSLLAALSQCRGHEKRPEPGFRRARGCRTPHLRAAMKLVPHCCIRPLRARGSSVIGGGRAQMERRGAICSGPPRPRSVLSFSISRPVWCHWCFHGKDDLWRTLKYGIAGSKLPAGACPTGRHRDLSSRYGDWVAGEDRVRPRRTGDRQDPRHIEPERDCRRCSRPSSTIPSPGLRVGEAFEVKPSAWGS